MAQKPLTRAEVAKIYDIPVSLIIDCKKCVAYPVCNPDVEVGGPECDKVRDLLEGKEFF